jgi:hypothetical protein
VRQRTVLANLAAMLRPGGVLLLGNVPDEALRLDHPPPPISWRPAGSLSSR